jgi:murein DD-endopeptidase MepM/ murein hydrolase activator NlpD
MNIIFVPRRAGQKGTYRLKSKVVYALATLIAVLPVLLGVGGYLLGKENSDLGPSALLSTFQQNLDEQRKEIKEARRTSTESMDALAMRLGKLQAHVIRLDALGGRLTKMAKLESGEFDFSAEPAQGGPESQASMDSETPVDMPEFLASLDKLSQQLDDRAQQLSLLESILMSRNLEDEVVPAGRPIKSGWLSSYYGFRTDPFTGRKELHKGLDFAGKMGSDVVAVASGVVTWAGKRYGYGNLVEINHGNGYTTRYGHNKKVLVHVGDTVKKGQVLAKMGSTGRSTGPHVHFEVRRNGKTVDPIRYIQASN